MKCSYIEADQFTYDNLKNYTLLVLTVPYRRNTAKATMYTEAEIAALKQYTDNGGKVILCSKSDRDNKYDNCAENPTPCSPPSVHTPALSTAHRRQ